MKEYYKKAAEMIKKSEGIIAFTGAGISTNSGIPDFRSENGIYAMLEGKFNLPYPEAVFDIDYFKKDPGPFFKISNDLLQQDPPPTPCHCFLAELEKLNKIELVITQNIDMLHQKAGTQRLVECHGSFETACCTGCSEKYSINEIKPDILQGQIPYCSCGKVIKPDVTFFGEQLPTSFYEIAVDPPQADLIIIMGSSLKVQPAAGFALNYIERVPSIIVNKTASPYDFKADLALKDDLDAFTENIKPFLFKTN